jgi:nitroreductase
MDLFDAISRRHSYRGPFLETPVPREHLEQILTMGLKAPSGCNSQSTAFVIVDSPELVRAIGQMSKGKAMQTAKAYIACVVNEPALPTIAGMSFEVEDCAAATDHMLLAITAMGYASVWIDGWLRSEGRAEKIGQMLNLPQGKRIRIILPVGVPAEQGAQPAKKPFAQRAWFNSYGAKE